jgi:hypothetical protein
MCFKNLPVEFDADGRARLKEGIRDPYSVATTRPAVAKTDAERGTRSTGCWRPTATSRTSTWTRSPGSPARSPCT